MKLSQNTGNRTPGVTEAGICNTPAFQKGVRIQPEKSRPNQPVNMVRCFALSHLKTRRLSTAIAKLAVIQEENTGPTIKI